MRKFVRIAALLLLAVVATCATPTGPSVEERAAYGDVAVVLIEEPVGRTVSVPTKGWVRGVGVGTARGVVGGTVIFLEFALHGASAGPLGVIVMGAVGAAVGVVYIPISVVNGAVTAVPADQVEATLPAFREVISDATVPDRFLAAFSRHAEGYLERALVPPSDATTLVEIRLASIRCGRTVNTWSLNAPFSIQLVAHVRVSRRADGQEIWAEGQAHRDGTQTFLEWAVDDARLAREAIDLTIEHLSRDLATVVFTGMRPLQETGKDASRIGGTN